MESFLKEVVKGKKFEITIDTQIFSKDIILKAAYNFLDRGYFFFQHDADKNIILQFTAKSQETSDPKDIIGEFHEEVLNVYLRDKLEKDNKVIREAIVTAAISNTLDESNFVSLDTDNKSMNGDQNQVDFDKDIDEILKEIENDPDLKIDEKEIENILKEIEDETQAEAKAKPAISINPDAIKDVKNKFKKD